jgi:penicillin amidase
MDTDILEANVGQLVGGDNPKLTKRADYSFAWGGFGSKDFFHYFFPLMTSSSVKSVMDSWDEIGKDGYFGIAMNLVMADIEGNIGYMLLLPQPNRKNKTPFIGCRVIDGTTTEFDWDGLMPLSANPRSYNPARGYIMTANNRQAPDHAINDNGATQMSTSRSQRIDEVLSGKIARGEKISVEDMSALQQDVHDINSRKLMPAILTLASQMKSEFSSDDRLDLEQMLLILEDWDNEM